MRAYAGDVNSNPAEIAREGLAAWREGDFETVEESLDRNVVVAHPSEIGGSDRPSEIATVMQFRNERVVSMQDYRTEAEALAAVGQK